MGKQFSLTSADKFQLGAYRADPSGPAKGGIVVIQEIFGVNHHIRAVCDRLAGGGYAALAPAFLRIARRGVRAAPWHGKCRSGGGRSALTFGP